MQVRQLPLSKKNVSELVVRIANNSHSSEWFFIAMNDCWWPKAVIQKINLRPAWAFNKLGKLGQDLANAACPLLIFCLARSALTAA